MTAPGRYAASDGSFAKSAGSAAARGGILIGIAVLIGFVLLWKGFDGGDTDAVVEPETTSPTTAPEGEDGGPTTLPDEEGGTTTLPDEEGGTTTLPGTTAVVVDEPSTVQVIVLNGTGQGGFAGERGAALGAAGYLWTPGNATGVPVETSAVYYTDGYADEAKEVAEALSGPADVVVMAPADPVSLATESYAEDAAAADVLVVLGTDGLLS